MVLTKHSPAADAVTDVMDSNYSRESLQRITRVLSHSLSVAGEPRERKVGKLVIERAITETMLVTQSELTCVS